MTNNSKIFFFLILITSIVMFFLSCDKKKKKSKDLNYLNGGYYTVVYQSDSLFIENNYKEAYYKLHNLFEKFTPINLPEYYEFQTYVKSAFFVNEKEKAKLGIIKLAKEYGLTWLHINNDETFRRMAQEFAMTEENFTKYNNEYLTSINFDLRNKLIKMKESDQLYRRDKMKKSTQDSIDKENSRILMNIFEKYGFPNEKIVGRNGFPPNADITAMLLHTPDFIRKQYFLPKILQFIKEGKCKPELYALLIDQSLLKMGQSKQYGTFDGPKEDDSLLLNNNELNIIRAKIGMPKYGYDTWRREKLHPDIFN